jgi:hypothetical protein
MGAEDGPMQVRNVMTRNPAPVAPDATPQRG